MNTQITTITKTEKLTDTKNLTVKETNSLSKELHELYITKYNEAYNERNKTNTDSTFKEWMTAHKKMTVYFELRFITFELMFCKRRSYNMIHDLENVIEKAKTEGVELI